MLERVEFDDPFLRDQRYTKVVHSTTVGRLRLIGGFTDWRGAARREGTPPDEFDLAAETARDAWRKPE